MSHELTRGAVTRCSRGARRAVCERVASSGNKIDDEFHLAEAYWITFWSFGDRFFGKKKNMG